jgi:hypothetical protein
VNKIHLAQNRDQSQASVKAVMNLQLCVNRVQWRVIIVAVPKLRDIQYIFPCTCRDGIRGCGVKANSHIPCRSHAALIHTCHAAPLPFSGSAVSFVKVRVVAGNIRTASLLPVTSFVELRVVTGRSRTRAGRQHAVSGRLMLSHIYHAVPMPRCAVALRGRFQNGMVVAWQGNGMTCVNHTRPHCVNQMGKTQSKPLAARHGMGTARCE